MVAQRIWLTSTVLVEILSTLFGFECQLYKFVCIIRQSGVSDAMYLLLNICHLIPRDPEEIETSCRSCAGGYTMHSHAFIYVR